jgi:hypothetical protein
MTLCCSYELNLAVEGYKMITTIGVLYLHFEPEPEVWYPYKPDKLLISESVSSCTWDWERLPTHFFLKKILPAS